MFLGFLGGSDSKESACSAGDPGLISGSGRSPIFLPGDSHGQRSPRAVVPRVTKIHLLVKARMRFRWVVSEGWKTPRALKMGARCFIVAEIHLEFPSVPPRLGLASAC